MSAKTPEGRITEKILRWLNAQTYCTARKVVASAMNRKGEPDIDCVRMGRAIKLEVKQPGTEHAIVAAVTPLQAKRLRDYAEAGALVGIVTSVEETQVLLDGGGVEPDEWQLLATIRARVAAAVVGSMT